jgi:hypothetical protein
VSGNGTTTIERSIDELLKKSDLGRSFDLHVVPGASREEDEWIYVVVAPKRPGIRAYEFAELLAGIEKQVRELNHKDEILLVPSRID